MSDQQASPALTDPDAIQRVCTVTGLVVGGLWALQAGAPLWEHALRLGLLLFVVAPAALWVIGRRLGAADRTHVNRLAVRALVAKSALLVAALGLSAVLRQVTGSADYLVAAGIALAIAFLGPRVLGAGRA